MKVEIKVPPMGESISEATIGEILKGSGQKVAMDDEVLELETDKVNQVLHAPEGGVVSLNVNVGDSVKIGQVIGFVDTAGTAGEITPSNKIATQPPTVKTAEKKKEGVRMDKESFIADIKKEKEQAPSAGISVQYPSPEKEAAVPSTPEKPLIKPSTSSTAGQRSETRRRMSKVRQVIAKRLVEAQHNSAMLTTFNEVDMSAVIALRSRYKDAFLREHQTKIGFMSFFCKASLSALQAFPDLNSYIDGEEIVHREYFDMGIAVSTDRGLFVPVVRDCDQLSFADIEKKIEELSKKAKEGSLTAEDLSGGGFTITNGGVFGSLLSTPILNPPQSGILGMHKIEKRPVVVDDQIVIRPMMYLALSYDHRIIDGKEAVSFLVHIKECLEDPARMLLGV